MSARNDYPAEPGRSDDLIIHVDHYNAAMNELDDLRSTVAMSNAAWTMLATGRIGEP